MPPFDFPNSPTPGQQVTGAGNQVYTFDSVKWQASGAGLNQATADARYVNVSGDTMAGDLLLAADPTVSMQAANKHYIDNAINLAGNYLGTWQVAANSPSISAGGSIANANYVAVTANPVVAETAPVGIPGIAGQSINNGDRIIWASGLSVWQILRGAGLTTSIGDGRYVQLAGGTMTGLLVLSADPGAALGAATKQYVDTKAAAGVVSFNTRTGAVTLSNTDVTTALTYTPYNATNPSGYQTAAQVTTALAPYATLAAPIFTGDARAVTPAVGDNDTSVATTAFVQAATATALTNIGRNLIHNAGFTIQQRGAGPWTTSGSYTADRWVMSFTNGTMSTSIVALSDANRSAIGDEAAVSAIRCVVVGSATAGSVTDLEHRIERIRRLSGKTVTVSFWAFAAAGTPKLGVSIDQYFGSGGSPSAYLSGTGQSVTISTTPARYSLTFAVASATGKTLGTNNDDWHDLIFWFSGATDQNTFSGSVGVQSGTFTLWGVQLEIGSVATPLEKRDPEQELRQCQRFYVTFPVLVPAAAAPSNLVLPVTMRAAPTVAGGGAGFATSNLSATAVTVSQTTAAAQTLTFSADL